MTTDRVHVSLTPRRIWAMWGLSRIALYLLCLLDMVPTGDVFYYFRGISGRDPSAMVEYPAVSLWPLQAIYELSFHNRTAFLYIFFGFCLLLDAAFFLILTRSRLKRPDLAGLFWIVFGFACLHMLIMRLDILPGVVVGLAALYLFTKPAYSSVFLGIATMLKLWPGVLAVVIVDKWRKTRTWINLATFAGTLVVLCALVALFNGPEHLVSPLTYQSDRGLQVESIVGTPFTALAALFNVHGYKIAYATSKSFEVTGPGVNIGLHVTTVLMLATVVFALAFALYRFFKGGWQIESALSVALLLVLMLVVSNKVYSPQYELWFGPILAVALASFPDNRHVRKMCALAIAVAVFSSILYPYLYDSVVTPAGNGIGVIPLVIRNILVIWMLGHSIAWVRHSLTTKEKRSAPVSE
ncbi:DUF2029 domain-containing protein [Arcanobacterium haemolyticum]|nr:DUF2029 domain-containing protein [Arcanobacterium haemolyticum]